MARRYDTNELIECHVYTRSSDEERGPHLDKLPRQRYIEIMISGAEHYQLDAEYIEFLKQHPHQPRPVPSEFKSLGEPPEESPTINAEELHKLDGKEEGTPLCFTVNGKVLKCLADRDSPTFQRMCRWINSGGENSHIWDLTLAKTLFDIKYGAPERLEDFTREHSAYIEDMVFGFMEGLLGGKGEWEVYCLFERSWKD
jgi:hypothetical protein